MKAEAPLLTALAALTLLVGPAWYAAGQEWVLTSAPITNWTAIASSADASRLVATVDGGRVYTSTNSGITWETTRAPLQPWTSVASSADGTELVAASLATIFVSTNGGAEWRESFPGDTGLISVGCSGTGEGLVAIATPGYPVGSICSSTNAGASWVCSATVVPPCYSVASSADGATLAASQYGGNPHGPPLAAILISTNSYATWQACYSRVLGTPCSVAISADGTRFVAAGWNGGPILTSSNSGGSLEQTSAPIQNWSSVSCSADGVKIVAVAGKAPIGPFNPGAIYSSADGGASWTSNSAPVTNWAAVASSADGCGVFAAVNGGGIYAFRSTPVPVLNATQSEGNLLLSWIIPTQPFALQENTDLATTNWTNVATAPILNLTNLHNQVTLPLAGRGLFFRLRATVR